MNRVIASLFIFACFGLVLSTGVSALSTVSHDLHVVLGHHSDSSHHILSY